jgi:HEPN domain-containing protein
MKPLTQEWIDKAEGDWATANREYRARKNPNYDAACFHCQQCAEKYLKAKLQEAGIAFRKTHDLENLLNDILPLEPTWGNLQNGLLTLTAYGVAYRYPGAKATKLEARDAVKRCRLVRKTVRQSFNLPT